MLCPAVTILSRSGVIVAGWQRLLVRIALSQFAERVSQPTVRGSVFICNESVFSVYILKCIFNIFLEIHIYLGSSRVDDVRY